MREVGTGGLETGSWRREGGGSMWNAAEQQPTGMHNTRASSRAQGLGDAETQEAHTPPRAPPAFPLTWSTRSMLSPCTYEELRLASYSSRRLPW